MHLDAEKRLVLPRAHGHIDHIRLEADSLEIAGWILDPQRCLDSVELYLNGEWIGTARQQTRKDVEQIFKNIPHSLVSGFHFETSCLKRMRGTRFVRVEAVGIWQGQPVATLIGLAREDSSDATPQPPEKLIRMIGSPSLDAYRTQGLQVFGDILQSVTSVADYGSFRRVLDWGSGCGRVSLHFLDYDARPEFFGCDVVPELVTWCSNHLRRGCFSLINPFPPTHFEGGFFDLVFSSSVMTHLSRDVQKLWLAEIRRILRPGGVFVASTLGESAFLRDFVYGRRDLRFRLKSLLGFKSHGLAESGGILDQTHNRSLGAAVPADYYRNVYQTAEYTKSVWSEYFSIIRYIERGLDHYQDLVLMVRPD